MESKSKSYSELIQTINDELVNEKMPFKVCRVCGEPFEPKRKNQVTCGSAKCVAEHKREVTRLWRANRSDFQIELARRKSRESMRAKRMRDKLLNPESAESKDISKSIQKNRRFQEKADRYEGNYGKAQTEDLLKTVPKIDTSKGNTI